MAWGTENALDRKMKANLAASTFHPGRTIVLIGLMGAGKTCVGRRIAQALGLPFVDADHEIEAACGMTVAEFFTRFGEAAFREGERKVMARLLEGPVIVLGAGGGAFMDPETREDIRRKAISVWLKADLELLIARTEGRGHRPLLNQGNPRETLARLMEIRYPVYAQADITVETTDEPADITAGKVLRALEQSARKSA
jgi:shikimate kinase